MSNLPFDQAEISPIFEILFPLFGSTENFKNTLRGPLHGQKAESTGNRHVFSSKLCRLGPESKRV
jgi:hypothetical protein